MNNTIKNINVLRNSTWTAWAENIAVVFIIAFTFYLLLPVNTHVPDTQSPKNTLLIPKGATSKSIISQLNARGYDVGFIDRLILTKMGKISQGEVKFKKQYVNRIDFLVALTKAKIPLLKITLIPGETKALFFTLVAQKLDINETKLYHAYEEYAKYPEAAIYADTYFVPKKMNETKLIKFLLKSSERTYTKLSTEAYGDYNQTKWHKVLTIASIIQKEAANREEMPLVASVIYNRLHKNMRLQMDGTLNYGKYSHIKVTPERIKTDTSSFNTYKHKGLPASPIGAVSSDAIHAALHPQKTNYLYFMRNKKGLHDFTDTFKKHRKNIKKVR